jgi:hypothetical protein
MWCAKPKVLSVAFPAATEIVDRIRELAGTSETEDTVLQKGSGQQ